MAGLTREQRRLKAEREDAIKASGLTAEEFDKLSEEERAGLLAKQHEAHANDPDLVLMAKGGEELEIHPTCVADHERLGWVVVE